MLMMQAPRGFGFEGSLKGLCTKGVQRVCVNGDGSATATRLQLDFGSSGRKKRLDVGLEP